MNSAEVTRARVVIAQEVIPSYRMRFFGVLSQRLAARGATMVVCAADSGSWVSPEVSGFCVAHVPGHSIGRVLLQPRLLRVGLRADVFVAEHAGRLVTSWIVVLLRKLLGRPSAFWGHGRNMQSEGETIAEKAKRWTLNVADWWFVYTPGCRDYLEAAGVRSDRITTVWNSTDTRGWREALGDTGQEAVLHLRRRLGIPTEAVVGLFCGRLYEAKRIDVLIAACALVHASRLDFHLLIVGDGPESALLLERTIPEWIHWIGDSRGPDKASAFLASAIFLSPGVLGLAVLDAFGAALPIVAAKIEGHGPEIEYLVDGLNGRFAGRSAIEFASAILDVLNSPLELARMSREAHASAANYSVERMADEFAKGLDAWLGKTQ